MQVSFYLELFICIWTAKPTKQSNAYSTKSRKRKDAPKNSIKKKKTKRPTIQTEKFDPFF